MDTSLSNKQDRLCCLPDRRQWEKKGIVRERERERETDISNVRGRITSLSLGCTQGSSRIQIPQFSNAAIMHSTQTLHACYFDWFFVTVIWIFQLCVENHNAQSTVWMGWMGCRLAQWAEHMSHVPRLCSGPGFDFRPWSLLLAPPSLSPCFLSYLELFYQ